MNRILFLVSLLCLSCLLQAQSFKSAPDQALTGQPITVTWQGEHHSSAYLTVVKPGDPPNHYTEWSYLRDGNPITLYMPPQPGSYELRLVHDDEGRVLARKPIEIKQAKASISAPASVDMGGKIPIQWQGPDFPKDYLTLVPVGAADGEYGAYVETVEGNPTSLPAPAEPGAYEIRYGLGRTNTVLARSAITVGAVAVELKAPTVAQVGSKIQIHWKGTDNPKDYITAVPADAPDSEWDNYVELSSGSPVDLLMPDQPGDYQLRYVSADGKVLVRKPLNLTDVSVTLDFEAPQAGKPLKVFWTGPGMEKDFILLERKVSDVRWEYVTGEPVSKGSPLAIELPKVGGDYRLGYYLAGGRMAAHKPLTFNGAAEPGSLRVFSEPGGSQSEAGVYQSETAVVVVLDASGSMLKREGGRRRMDTAKEALASLLGGPLQEGAPFALRVFGHREAGSCATDLEIPLGPLNLSATRDSISRIMAKNMAKTPIGDSLDKVAEDLNGHESRAMVVLITDGEETCGGDAAAAIQRLRKSGIDVRVNIVGFAINEPGLKQTFRNWSQLGGGRFFDAADHQRLASQLNEAVNPVYIIHDGNGVEVARGQVNGASLTLNPGTYQLTLGHGRHTIQIKAGEETALRL